MSSVRVTGHFGEWLQGRLGPDGPVVLVTLPCDALAVEGHRSTSDTFQLIDNGLIGEARAKGFLGDLGGVAKDRVELSADMPLGGGAGASTAALVALAAALGVSVAPEVMAQACRATEGAVDPLMIADPDGCLWASREARVIRRFAPVPDFDIVGGFWGAAHRTEAEDVAFPDVSDLVAFWDRAARTRDRAALAGIASEAARRTTEMRGPSGDPTRELARELGAIGHVRAHTGSARGLVFAPGKVPAGISERLTAEGYQDVLAFATGAAS